MESERFSFLVARGGLVASSSFHVIETVCNLTREARYLKLQQPARDIAARS